MKATRCVRAHADEERNFVRCVFRTSIRFQLGVLTRLCGSKSCSLKNEIALDFLAVLSGASSSTAIKKGMRLSCRGASLGVRKLPRFSGVLSTSSIG